MSDDDEEELDEISDDDAGENEEFNLEHGPDFSRMGTISEKKIEEAKHRVDDMLTQVKADLDRRGIPEPIRPKNHPKSLADVELAELTNAEVASLYSQYVAYSAYIGDELAQIEGMEEMAKKLLKDTLGELKDALFAKKMKGPEATAAAMKDELYRALDMEHAKLFFMKAIMKRRYRGYIQQAAALSRTVELRKLDFEQNRRDGNLGLGGKRPAPRGFGAGAHVPGTTKKA